MNGEGMRKVFISTLLLTLMALYSVTPLLYRPEFAGREDVHLHITWAEQISDGIKEGILFPRWLSEYNNGYGSPTPTFYSPLSHWLTAVLSLYVPLFISLKIVTFAGLLLSGVSMSLFLRNYCSYSASMVGGMAYQLMPYHVFELYWRGALPAAFAFIWLPLILHYTYNGVTQGRVSNFIGMAFSYAGLVLTHIPSAYIFTYVIAAFALFLSLKNWSFRLLLKFILAYFFGLSLSSIYFIPMFFERKFVHMEFLAEGYDYRDNFLFMNEDSINPFRADLSLMVALQALLIFICLKLYYRERLSGNTTNYPIFAFSLWLFAFSLFLLTPFSIPVWGLIPGLPTIVFPWRWTMVTSFATSIIIGLTFDTFSITDIKKDRFVRIFSAIFYGLVIGNFYLASSYIMTARPVQKKDTALFFMHGGGKMIENRPIWLTDREKDFYQETKKPVVGFNEGTGTIEIISWNSQSRFFKVNVSIPSTVRISTFYYPGWTALINGKEIPIGIEKDSGAMLLTVPPGRNKVLLEFRDTPLRRVAKWVSIISLLAAVLGLIRVSRGAF